MTALTSNLSHNPKYGTKDYQQQHGSSSSSSSSSSYVVEEIKGLIKVHKDGYVERPNIVPFVSCDLNPNLNIISRDIIIDNVTNIWARFYVPISQKKLPLLIYFHGGGFCVGSAAWSCYHDFLAKLSSKVKCLIMSVNYRLAPENPLPAPYDDGLKALTWLKQKLLYQNEANDECEWWIKNCNFSRVFLGGDSAGGNIAYNVAKTVFSCESFILKPLKLKGLILIQPFFGGEVRTLSEKCMVQLSGSALNLEAYDTYWRLALPYGEDKDHPWCNPLMKLEELKVLTMPCLVCISEMDILKDRNLEFCDALRREGKRVECEVFKDVGHAFQILSKSKVSKIRAIQMMSRVKSFISI